MDTAVPEASLLVVDDEPNIRELLSASLRLADFKVTSAATGADALAAVSGERPGLVLLDVMLPDISGFAVVRRLREAAGTRPGADTCPCCSSRRRTGWTTRSAG